MMRVAHITLHSIEGNETAQRDAPVRIDGILIWPHYGWYADMRLEEVTGPEFGRIEDEATSQSGFGTLRFRPGYEKYDYREESAFVQIHDRELVQGFIMRGALTDPQVTAELAKKLEALIREMTAPKQ